MGVHRGLASSIAVAVGFIACGGLTPTSGGDTAPLVDGGLCTANGPIAVVGDYTSSNGTEYWLRKSLTAATYTVVPGGAPSASTLPQLFRIERVCPQWLLLVSSEGAFGRLDWAPANGALGICVRTASSIDAATALSAPDSSDAATGCAGSAWILLTKVSQ